MKKLVIWDGDETLWSGTITERNVRFSLERQNFCLDLALRGVLQAIASYNRPEDIMVMLHSSGLDQVFLHSQATLDRSVPKSAMVRQIIQLYDLSRLEDVVFIDDDPLNREDVRVNCPGVDVIEPGALAIYARGYLQKPHYTDEDRLRVSRYRSEAARKTAAAAYAGDQRAFLTSCNITMTINVAYDADRPRLEDLLTRAHRTAGVVSWIKKLSDVSTYDDVVVARVQDRFGDYGLSGFAVVAEDEIVALVVSCRTQGRGVGSALLGWVINNFFVTPGLCEAVGRWVATDYNAGIEALYSWYGFSIERPGIHRVARRPLVGPVALPEWIQIESVVEAYKR